ncbi:MAG: hypothetical protein KC501_26730 [Myxococcales bacterium]|nr:hypothetical protein [Myxococcales bacterium]
MRRWTLVVGAVLACRSTPTTTGPDGADASDAAARPSAAEPPAALAPDEATPNPWQADVGGSSQALAEFVDEPPPHLTPPEGWPAALPWVSDADLSYAQVDASEAGDVRVVWAAPSTRIGEVGARLHEGLRRAGYEASKACALEASGRCELRLGDRLVLMSASVPHPASTSVNFTLHLLPDGHQPRERLPGRCVVPPQRTGMVIVSASGIDQEGEYRQTESHWSMDTSPGPDLDGDGQPELYVPRPSKQPCPWDVPHDVYVMRGACGHRVGTIVGLVDGETEIAPFVKGLRTVLTTAEWSAFDGNFGVPNQHTRTRRYEFDGKTLRVRADEEIEGKCHHCGVEHCTVP